jgi:hypothetical protein
MRAQTTPTLRHAAEGPLEGIVDRPVRVLFVCAFVGTAIHDELGARDRQVDPNAKVPSLLLVTVRRFESDAAREYLGNVRLEILDVTADVLVHRAGRCQIPEDDVNRRGHRKTSKSDA